MIWPLTSATTPTFPTLSSGHIHFFAIPQVLLALVPKTLHELFHLIRNQHKMISVRCQGKPFNIIVIQIYAPTTMLKMNWNSSMKTYKIFQN